MSGIMDNPKNKRIVCLGLIVADILVRGVPTPFDFDIDTHFVNEISLQSGGDANNQAQTLAKLGSQAAIAGRIGHDAIGEILYKKICSLGIDTTALEIADNCKTDFSVVLITETGKRTFLFQPGGNNDFCLGKHIYHAVEQANILSLGSLRGLPGLDGNPVIEILHYAREKGVVTVADMTSGKKMLPKELLFRAISELDYFLPSRDELIDITGCSNIIDGVKLLLKQGVKTIVVKCGSDGVIAATGNELFYVPACPVSTIDTTGAGDNFVAGILHKLAEGAGLKECICFANAIAAISTTTLGACTADFSTVELQKFEAWSAHQLRVEHN